MTFTEIVDNVAEALNLTSDDAIARIGKNVNRRYKRLTSSLGLLPTRRQIQTVAFTIGNRRITVPSCEKVISVQDLASGDPRPITLTLVTYAEMLTMTPRADRPTHYAIESITAHATVLLTNFTPAAAFSVSVEGESRASTLSGVLEPAFNESYHDILEFGAKADELRKKEKVALARDAEMDFERRLGELRLHLAVSGHQDIVQGKERTMPVNGFHTSVSGGGGGGGAVDSPSVGSIVIESTDVGQQDNWNPELNGDTLIIWSGASALTVTGLAGGTPGQRVVFRNNAAVGIIATFANDSASSDTDAQLQNAVTSANTPVAPGGHIVYMHDGTDWKLIEHEQGAWITPTFSAADYTGSGSLTVTLAAGDVTTQAYYLAGRRLTVAMRLVTISTGGTAATGINVGKAAYGGFTATKAIDSIGKQIDAAGVEAMCSLRVAAAGSLIVFEKVPSANWSNAAVNNTQLIGQIDFEVT